MNERIDLNGNWKVTGTMPDGQPVGPFAGTVPGHVHTDLLRHGLIKDPMWRDQANECQWVEQCEWIYETAFEWPSDRDRASAQLCFEGLDTIAAVYLNDSLVGEADNMFIPHAFAVEHALQPGLNRLKVRFTPIPAYLADKDTGKYVSLFSQDRVYVRRMQCTFGWDWVHRLVSYGIWRPVYIEAKPAGRIAHSWVRTLAIQEEAATLAWEVEAAGLTQDGVLRLELAAPGGESVWSLKTEIDPSQPVVKGKLTVERPQLWWPAGYGEPALYRFSVSLSASDGEALDVRSDEIGIRTVEVEQIPDDRGSSFTMVVNGERIFAKGGNWVPADPFPSAVTAERYAHLLQLLVDGHMNMLRVWGGGTYELPEFWRTCDRLGILVSVDFMMACAEYPEDEPWFIAAMKTEVASAIKRLRNHPSLVLWYGDNELAMNNNEEDDYWGKRVCAEVTTPLCAELDPSRPFFPTSPIYGRPFNSQDAGDCHVSPWYEVDFLLGDMRDYRERIREGRGRFLSESAIPGSPPLSSLLKMMTMADVADEQADIWEFRTKDNPYNGQDELTHYRLLEKTAAALFGESANPLEKVKKMEYVQYEFERMQIEHYRRCKYDSSGVLFWMYNDCWPASGWSMVDYYGYPKAGYYGAKRASKPVMISLEDRGDELGVWVVNDTLTERRGVVRVRGATTAGVYRASCEAEAVIPANEAALIHTIAKRDWGLTEGAANAVVQAIWEPQSTGSDSPGDPEKQDQQGDQSDSAIFFDVLPKELVCPPAKLEIECVRQDATSGRLVIRTDVYARVVAIENELLLDDNYFDLMPGETKEVAYRTQAGIEWNGTPVVTCWNDAH